MEENNFIECKRCHYDNEKEDMATENLCKDCFKYLKENKKMRTDKETIKLLETIIEKMYSCTYLNPTEREIVKEIIGMDEDDELNQ